MPTYELSYAEKHLQDLFQEARTGEDVIIVRADGLSCQLLPIANVKEEEPAEVAAVFATPAFGEFAPA